MWDERVPREHVNVGILPNEPVKTIDKFQRKNVVIERWFEVTD